MKTVLVTGHFREPNTIVHPKIMFFAALAEALAEHGYRFEFLDFTQKKRGPDLPECCGWQRFDPKIERYAGSWLSLLKGQMGSRAQKLAATVYSRPDRAAARRRPRWLLAASAATMERALEQILEQIKPDLVINWNAYTHPHILLGELCRRHGIRRLVAEGGIVPGTIEFEERGHQADGFAVEERDVFQQLPLNDEMLTRASDYTEHMRERRQSKKRHEDLDLSDLEKRLEQSGRRLIFYGATQEFGELRPRSSPWSHKHSPHFTGDHEAVGEILKLLEPLNAELLVKTHPNMPKERWPEHPRMTLVREGDLFKCLDLADAFVVNSTQVAGFGCIQEKPTVLLGANGLTGKGCCYELGGRDQLEAVLRRALDQGYTREMRQGWLEYTARNIEYFAFAIHPEAEPWLGRGPQEAAEMLRDFVEKNVFLRKARQAAKRGAKRLYQKVGGKRSGLPNPDNDRRLRALKDIHRGQRAFLIGNGPSLKVEDLDKLKNEITFASNKIFLAFDQTDWRPTYFTACDRQVAKHLVEEFSNLEMTKIFNVNLHEHFKHDPRALFLNPFKSKDNGEDEWDLIRGVRCGQSVIYMDIKLAYWMGIRTMYTIGVDFSFNVPTTTTVDPVHGHEVLVAQGEQNHFHPEYRPEGETWSVPKLDVQAEEFAHARKFLEARGGKIYNASRKTALEAWERVDLDQVLSGAHDAAALNA